MAGGGSGPDGQAGCGEAGLLEVGWKVAVVKEYSFQHLFKRPIPCLFPGFPRAVVPTTREVVQQAGRRSNMGANTPTVGVITPTLTL